MAKPYSDELRERVVRYVLEGHPKSETASLFGMSRHTIYRWCIQQEREGHCHAKPPGGRLGRGKIDKIRLQTDVAMYPTATLTARAERFGVSKVAIFLALQRMNITYQRNWRGSQWRTGASGIDN